MPIYKCLGWRFLCTFGLLGSLAVFKLVSEAVSRMLHFYSVLGLSYIFMGQTDEKGQGAISPQNYVVAFKGKSQRVLDVLKYQRC